MSGTADIGKQPLEERLGRFPLRLQCTPLGAVAYRQAGGPPPRITHVLLHGIGSGSGNWLRQLEAAQADLRQAVGLLAWEAPGYGDSDPVAGDFPDATAYAQRLWAWLDALDVGAPVTLVGHSLGCLMAARAAVMQPSRVHTLVLLSPARGYASAPAQQRESKLRERLAALDSLGPEGMATKRAAAMLSPTAPAEYRAFIQAAMARIRPDGYRQAARLLAGGDLGADVQVLARQGRMRLTVASGSADTITPPDGCQAVAAQAGQAWTDLGAAGHACALEAADAVNTLIGLQEPPNEP